MKQNGNKIRYMKYKGSLKLAAAVLAVSLAFLWQPRPKHGILKMAVM